MQPELIICEQSGQWAAAWRRAARASHWDIRLREARSLDACRQVLADARAGFVLVELTGDSAVAVLEFLDRLACDYPDARAAVLAQRGNEVYELLARELGAIHFIDSPRRLAPLVDVVGRYLASQPLPEESLRQQIWRRLPWKSAATAKAGTHMGEN
ncbi:MAG TPA: hypothetical protein VHV55_12400 [Pirellulales bacterium]|jgi:DNA-binding NtrC family response regulator|nr:hypothetical protein [Pirellulales bacterium]